MRASAMYIPLSDFSYGHKHILGLSRERHLEPKGSDQMFHGLVLYGVLYWGLGRLFDNSGASSRASTPTVTESSWAGAA